MDEQAAGRVSTSSAATQETEPEVVAAVSSAEGTPDLPTAFRVGGIVFGVRRTLAMLAAGMAVGYAASRWMRGRG